MEGDVAQGRLLVCARLRHDGELLLLSDGGRHLAAFECEIGIVLLEAEDVVSELDDGLAGGVDRRLGEAALLVQLVHQVMHVVAEDRVGDVHLLSGGGVRRWVGHRLGCVLLVGPGEVCVGGGLGPLQRRVGSWQVDQRGR